MLQEPLVSIIIPAYNRPDFLGRAIESAIAQTYQNIEIIIFDDCSSTDLKQVVDSFQDTRIIYHRNSQNLGLFTNVIQAHRFCHGKYVANLNDDDLWNENFLEKLVPHLEVNPEVNLAFSDHYLVDQDGNIDPQATEENTRHWKRANLQGGLHQPFHREALVDRSIHVANAAVIRRDAIDWENDFPSSEIGPYWDYYIAYLACRSGRAAYYCSDRLTQYRVHNSSMTQANARKNFQMRRNWARGEAICYEQFIEDLRLQEFKPYFQKKLAKAKTALGMSFLRSEQPDLARPYFYEALKQHQNLRTVLAIVLSFMPRVLISLF